MPPARPCFAWPSPPPALAATDVWTGTWKEDTSKSVTTGTVSYTPTANGFHFSNGSTIQYDFTCDGKTYPTYAQQSMKCTMSSGGTIDWTTFVNGKVVAEAHRTFSADGKAMTIDTTYHLDDGSTTKETVLRVRRSGTTGLAGEWANNKLTEADPEVMKISMKNDTYHMEFMHSSVFYDAKFDGTESKAMGKDATPGETQSFKAESPNRLVIGAKLNGKVMGLGEIVVSPDGKTMTRVTWLPGKEAQKNTIVYVKQ